MTRSRSFIATPPGETIKEQLESRCMSQKEFASRMGMSEKHISKLINGDVQLTQEVAYKLEMVLGIPARFWNNLEALYREKLAKVEAENEMEQDIELSKRFPYKEMAQFGWVPQSSDSKEKVIALRKFFETITLDAVFSKGLSPRIACRRQSVSDKSDYALMAWAQEAKLEARNIPVSPINYKGLDSTLHSIRAMTVDDPEVFCPKLVSMMADCGIALVFLPLLCGSYLHGATFYDGKKIVIGLTVRGKDADKFWFSLFHEVGHILLGHLNKWDDLSDDDEDAANVFARDNLISPSSYNEFTGMRDYSKSAIIAFANKEGLSPGIVVGRLQKDGFIPFSRYHDLKTKYELTV
ncbi:MAG: helix-turn-helix domain-containing protein [Clostridia bacterium]|nr:helix-turn-helix domain-containing protein [Clostridia bacterium]